MTPLILDADLRGLDARVQLALHQDPADVLRALFRDLLPDEPGSAPTLQAELDLLAPLEDAEVTLHACTDQVTLTVESHSNGFTYLPALHAALARRDPHVLPGILAALEDHSTRLTPQFGPREAHELAGQWHHEDRVIEDLLQEHPQWDTLSRRDVIRLARRSGRPHPWVVRDETPWPYLRGVPGLDETVARLRPLIPEFPELAPLLSALPELREAYGALPEMTQEERGCGLLDHLPSRAYSPLEEGAGAMVDLLDEVMDLHWQGGETGAALHLILHDCDADRARLADLLTHAPRVEAALNRIHDALTTAENTWATALQNECHALVSARAFTPSWATKEDHRCATD
ncbi:hypothetical protein J2Y00_003664 [Deinococcus soli (ex Cha et al. 2016)]|uniref:Uncharacterized protein n=1 Tax=Deinococcus soli (ex Cha et al. 2016) TaxID=1309411 RepID=A0AAE4BME4_9DEIO|nr:hypothetical protein [Deinococcus soli (ex Cha et al. 2016)]MDR6220053.1 hypothetical protein [Deinococcus soli (ex Cha et al. 2016)]